MGLGPRAMLCASVAGFLLLAPVAGARSLPAEGPVVGYVVVDQDLHEALVEIGRRAGLRVQVSAAVTGRVHGRLPDGTPAVLFERLASVYGFDCYYDGSTLFVSGADEAVSKVLDLGAVGLDRLSLALEDLGIADERWPLRAASGGKVALLDGPPRYAALVEQTLAALGARPEAGAALSFHGTTARRR